MTKTPDKHLDELMDRLRKKYAMVYAADLPNVQKIATGNAGLDYVTGGGIPRARVTMLYGPSSCGKSTLALTIAKRFLGFGMPVFYIDSERTIVQEDKIRLGIDDDRLITFRPDNAEAAISFIQDISEEGSSLVIIDSIPTLEPTARLEKLSDNASASEMAVKARFWAGIQGMLLSLAEANDITLLFVNQVRHTLNSFGASTSVPGGSALQYMSSCMLELYASTAKSTGATTEECLTYIKCVKNKTGVKGRQTSMMLGPHGYDEAGCLLDLSEQFDLVVKSGSHYKLSEELAAKANRDVKLGQGKESVKTLLRSPEEEDLAKLLYSEIMSASTID